MKDAELVCPVRFDVFCNAPQKGVKISTSSSDEDDDLLISILKIIGLTGLVIMGIIVYCVVKNKPKQDHDEMHEMKEDIDSKVL